MTRLLPILLLTCFTAFAQAPPPLPPVMTNATHPRLSRVVSTNTQPVVNILHVTDLVPTGTNFVFIIECSTNLVSWQDKAILPRDYNWNTWTNTNPPTNAYYRIVAVPLKK